jgi:phospholipase C
VTATFNPPQNIYALNHIVFLAQENRSFDHYFGALREYWAQIGYPDQSFDGLPQFNPISGLPPLYGPPPTNPGCNPADPPPSDCVFDPTNPVTSYHLITQCIENPSPSWDEAHVDWNVNDEVGKYNDPLLNGFVKTAGGDARVDGFYDVNGIRAMGYYDGTDLNYYYFMASNFGTSDSWFHPVMTRTHPNREYLVAATSQGYVYPVGTDSQDKNLLTATTIFQELQAAGISWKIYVDPTNSNCGAPYDPHCLINLSYMQFFKWGHTIPDQYPGSIATISQYFDDLNAGTLPQVALIEPATDAGFDEHPSVSDSSPNRIQLGENFVASLINGLMSSSSWKDSAFILTWDENGGLYDHVPPVTTVSPDGIQPVDMLPGDVCNSGSTGSLCDFTVTGYRIPLIVVSPFSNKNYVWHKPADTTAILKLIETRFNLSPLTQRDAAQPDMSDFFDFTNPPWLTPPTPPTPNTSNQCYLNKLP